MTHNHDQSEVSASEVAEDHDLRSQYMQKLIGELDRGSIASNLSNPPRILVQFWDDAQAIPADVQECLSSWEPLEELGFERLLFEDRTAESYIDRHFSERHLAAFKSCQHPAMRADYFRLCFMLESGGLYVDADDIYQDAPIDAYLDSGGLKLQALCYDVETDSMVDQPQSVARSQDDRSRIYYVNNNPLIASRQHPIIAKALERATTRVLSAGESNRDIQSLTGPGNLTACLVAHSIEIEKEGGPRDFELLRNWHAIAVSKWPLAYRSDQRNWRNWGARR